MHEADLDKLAGMRLQLEVQVNTVESANINANTLGVMRRGADALRDIHNGLYVHPSHTFSPSYSNFDNIHVGFSVPITHFIPFPPILLPPAARRIWVLQ